MSFHSCRLPLLVLMLSVGLTSPGSAWPPVPPPVRPFDDPSIGVRIKALWTPYEQSANEASIKLSKARSAIRAAQGGNGTTEAEKQAVREYVVARKRTRERLRELGRLHHALRSTASAGDLNSLEETIKSQWNSFGSTEENTLELLEAVID